MEEDLDQWNLPDILNDMAVYLSESGTSFPMHPEVGRASILTMEQLEALDSAYQDIPYMSDKVPFHQHRP